MNTPYKILFVCTGNLYRSPLAEGIIDKKCMELGISYIQTDSAGTSTHIREGTRDPRLSKIAQKHNIKLKSKSRRFLINDFERFDLILAMDDGNIRFLKKLEPTHNAGKIKMMRDYDTGRGKGKSIPDPYNVGFMPFARLYSVLNRCCDNLLRDIIIRTNPP